MLSLSVCRWLVLTAAEVQASQDEPETFIQEQEDLWYEKDVVPCAESLLCALFEQRPSTTLPLSLGILRQLIDAPSVAEPVSADRLKSLPGRLQIVSSVRLVSSVEVKCLFSAASERICSGRGS